MSINLPVIPSSKAKKNKKLGSNIPKWTVFSLGMITVLVVVAILKTILPLLLFGLVLAFIWSQATKPVAHLGKEQKPSGKQLNLFHQNQVIAKHSSDRIEKERRAA